MTLLLFPRTGIVPSYQFSKNIIGYGDWRFVIFIRIPDMFLNARFTKIIPLTGLWLIGFFLQALLRNRYFDTSIAAALNPITGLTFLLFTFYRVSEPGTTQFKVRDQIIFGVDVALLYGLLVRLHVVFGLFFTLFVVCTLHRPYLCYPTRFNVAPTVLKARAN